MVFGAFPCVISHQLNMFYNCVPPGVTSGFPDNRVRVLLVFEGQHRLNAEATLNGVEDE